MKVSAVVLNYRSPYHLSSFILPHVERMECVDEIVIVHGNPDTKSEYSSDHCRVVNLHHRSDRLDETCEGMLARFRGFQGARNSTVLSLDDDLIIPEASLDRLIAEYEKDPETIHSLAGRNCDKKLRYSVAPQYGEVTFALPGMALFPRSIADDVFDWLGRNRDEWMIRHRQPERNCEDLLASLLCIKRTGRLNMAYPLQYVSLRTHGAGADAHISDDPHHMSERTRFLQHVVPLLQVGGLIKTAPSRICADGDWRGVLKAKMYHHMRDWLLGPQSDMPREWER